MIDAHSPSIPRPTRFDNILFAAIGRGIEPAGPLRTALALADADEARIQLDDVETPRAWPPHRQNPSAADRARQVAARVVEQHHDLVIVAPEATRADHATTHSLATICPAAVLVLRMPIMSGNVIAVVDPTDRIEVNTAALRQADAHARRVNGIVHVIYAAGHAVRHPRVAARSRRAALLDLVDRIGLTSTYEIHVSSLAPERAIDRLADMVDGALIVIGSDAVHDRAPLSRTISQLLVDARHSLLVARPPDFSTETATSGQQHQLTPANIRAVPASSGASRTNTFATAS